MLQNSPRKPEIGPKYVGKPFDGLEWPKVGQNVQKGFHFGQEKGQKCLELPPIDLNISKNAPKRPIQSSNRPKIGWENSGKLLYVPKWAKNRLKIP